MPMRQSLAAVLFTGLLIQPAMADKPLLKKQPVDLAVDKALEFLSNTQSKTDGSWTAGRNGKHVAVTSLAVMAFLSAGHVPGEGPYGKNIERGVRWVLSMQRPNGLLANDGGHEMYHHGIATLMLAEVCGMVHKELGKEVRRAVEKAVALILKAQRTQLPHRGGWRYRIDHYDGSDISVTGWQIMALRAAKNLGCDVPADTITRGRVHQTLPGPLRRLSLHALRAGHRAMHGNVDPGPGIVRQGRAPQRRRAQGRRLSDPQRKPAALGRRVLLLQHLLRRAGDVSGRRQLLEHLSPRLHEIMIAGRRQGATGAWQGGGSDSAYGPNYCTAMSVLALTVEYRFLPIYQRGEEPKEKDS